MYSSTFLIFSVSSSEDAKKCDLERKFISKVVLSPGYKIQGQYVESIGFPANFKFPYTGCHRVDVKYDIIPCDGRKPVGYMGPDLGHTPP